MFRCIPYSEGAECSGCQFHCISSFICTLSHTSLTFPSPLTPSIPTNAQTEESEDDAVDSDFDASEEDEVKETEREAAAEDERKRKRKQWIKPSRPQVYNAISSDGIAL